MIKEGLRGLFKQVVAIYFRDVEVSGDVPRADTTGRLFAANHVNGLVDPILVITQTPCFCSPVAKSTLWKIPGLKWLLDAADAVPIVRRRDDPNKSADDNEAVFTRVANHLGRGNILIFPEGTSHNEPKLIALRSGAGRMLERAAKDVRGLTFQAVALEWDARDTFRSRALVLFGPVREFDALKGDDLGAAATEQIREDLSELLVEGATWEERIALVRVAEMFANDQKSLQMSDLNRLGRRIEAVRKLLGATNEADVRATEARVGAYYTALADAEVEDRLVARFAETVGTDREPSLDMSRAGRAALRVLVLPLAMIGMVLYWLPYQVPRLVTNRIGDDQDTVSTYKLGVGLVVFPLWAAIVIAIAFWKLPHVDAAVITGVVLASPFAALPWLDRWDRMGARMRDVGPSEDRRALLVQLAETRRALMDTLTAMRDRAEEIE